MGHMYAKLKSARSVFYHSICWRTALFGHKEIMTMIWKWNTDRAMEMILSMVCITVIIHYLSTITFKFNYLRLIYNRLINKINSSLQGRSTLATFLTFKLILVRVLHRQCAKNTTTCDLHGEQCRGAWIWMLVRVIYIKRKPLTSHLKRKSDLLDTQVTCIPIIASTQLIWTNEF